jgi:hypothetical protein
MSVESYTHQKGPKYRKKVEKLTIGVIFADSEQRWSSMSVERPRKNLRTGHWFDKLLALD